MTNNRYWVRKASLNLQAVLYMLAGLNHFIHPAFYLPLIPPYLPAAHTLNVLAGVAEVLLGAGLLYRPTRRMAALGIIALLMAFLPAHVYMIQCKGCVPPSFCLPVEVAWVRLLVVHPLLMAWAWWNRH